MDKSETYIKMSDCPEIQEQKPQILIGLIPHYYKGIYRYEVDSDGNFWYYEDHFIWLPRQDQLQEMFIERWWGDGKPANCISAMLQLFYWWLEEAKPANQSMEQLWLEFYMWEIYNKVWDGDKWEKE